MNTAITAMIHAAKSGGKVVRRLFGEGIESVCKSTVADLRTTADVGSDAAIRRVLTKAFPRYNLYTEENGFVDKGSQYTFVVDPLDGTSNFVMGLPNFTVSIALLKNSVLTAGVVYVPVLDEVYWAVRGKGAYREKTRIRVNDEPRVKFSAVAYTCGYTSGKKHFFKVSKRLTEKGVKRILANWSPAYDYCLLASGRLEAMVNYHTEIYDFAAGKLLVQEAGGSITDFSGRRESNPANCCFLASNGTKLHRTLLKLL
jgi:myo-inositol-1(or 4)-monophosphatase